MSLAPPVDFGEIILWFEVRTIWGGGNIVYIFPGKEFSTQCPSCPALLLPPLSEGPPNNETMSPVLGSCQQRPAEGRLQVPHGSWELNWGPLKEQQILSLSELALQLHTATLF